MSPKTRQPTRELGEKEKIIGIVGGVGPAAGNLLQKFVIEESAAQIEPTRDQDHLGIIHLSLPGLIPDRTDFLLGRHNINPANGAFTIVQMISNSAKSLGGESVVGVPCNTFHADPIFGELTRLTQEGVGNNIKMLHITEETVGYIQQEFRNITKIGLMSTTGTRDYRLFHDPLEGHGYKIIEIDKEMQEELHDTIYNEKWGIKTVSPITDKAKANIERYTRILKEKGAEAIILGCTEIPIALPGEFFEDTPLIDPMRALAYALVRESRR